MSCLVGRLLYATRSKGSSPGAPTAFPPTSALRMPAVAPTVVWTAVQQFSSRLVKSPDSRMSSVSVGSSSSLPRTDRKSVVSGKRVSVRVDLGGRRLLKENRSSHVDYLERDATTQPSQQK